MKKETAISLLIAILLASLSVSAASAQTAVDLNAQVNTGGGLGKGLNSMVRNILGEDAEQQPIAPQASLMMESNAAADMAAPAPESRMMKADASNMMAFSATASAPTDEDVSQLITELLSQDSRIQAIDASDTHVRMTYRTEGIVLRFIRVQIPVTAEAYVSGTTDVTYPWYVRLQGGNEVRARLDARIASHINTESITPENRILLLNEMHAFFQAEM